MNLDILWYLVIVLAVICYAVLDGFDLGVGLLHLIAKNDHDRRIFLNAIGPVWDGNEVWLVIVIGALFAGFPSVYSTLLTTFYLPVMILLMGLMLRAVSIEFRSKKDSSFWRHSWDFFFALGSLVISFGVGMTLGNLIHGIPLDQNQVYTGTFWTFFHPYPIVVGLTTTALFAMHGSIFLVMKTTGKLHDHVRHWVPTTIAIFIALYLVATGMTIATKPYMTEHMRTYPLLFLVPIAALVAIFLVPYLMQKTFDGWAFISSCFSVALLLSLAAIGTYPYMIRSSINPDANSLLISNTASSELTLKILLVIVGIGIPLVLAYGFYVYRVFRGKVEIDTNSY